MKIYSYVTLLNEAGNPYIEKKSSFKVDGRRSYSTPNDNAEFIINSLGIQNCADEFTYCICLDAKNHLIGCFEASHGTSTASILGQREIFQKALMIGANGIVLTHNHPSGDCTPSNEDVMCTKRTIENGKLLGIELLDHIIVARGDHWLSLREYIDWKGAES